MCEELPADGVLLIYISASGDITFPHPFAFISQIGHDTNIRFVLGSGGHTSMSPAHMGNYVGDAENTVSNIQSEAVSTLPSCSACDSIASSVEQNVGDDKGSYSGGLNIGFSGNGGTLLISDTFGI